MNAVRYVLAGSCTAVAAVALSRGYEVVAGSVFLLALVGLAGLKDKED